MARRHQLVRSRPAADRRRSLGSAAIACEKYHEQAETAKDRRAECAPGFGGEIP